MSNNYKIQLKNNAGTDNLYPKFCVDTIFNSSGASVSIPYGDPTTKLINTTFIPDDMKDEIVFVIAVAESAPSTCATGDKYLNSSSKKVFTATAANTWGATGTDAVRGVVYFDKVANRAWYYTGTTVVSISPQIIVQTRTSGTETNVVLSEKGIIDSLDAATFPRDWNPSDHIAPNQISGTSIGVIKISTEPAQFTVNGSGVLQPLTCVFTSSGIDDSAGYYARLVKGQDLIDYLTGYRTGEGGTIQVAGVLATKMPKQHDGTGIKGLDTGNKKTIAFDTANGYGMKYSIISES